MERDEVYWLRAVTEGDTTLYLPLAHWGQFQFMPRTVRVPTATTALTGLAVLCLFGLPGFGAARYGGI